MLFGSSDAANAITIDKTPASLWVIDVSVRIFGLNPWSVLVPQALEGVAAVALLYAAVRRVSGPGAALLAAAVMALTPVAALMFRFNNPGRATGARRLSQAPTARSVRARRTAAVGGWSRPGAAVGFGFLAKMLQALLVLPGFIAAYLVAGSRPLGRRLLDVAILVAAVIVSGGWYLLLVEVWPPNSRPYIGGSQHDSIIELALGYNGFGRLTGDEPGGLGNMNFDVGWARLFGHGMGVDIAWLLPAAVVCLVRDRRSHQANSPNRPDQGGTDHLGRLAVGHGGGVQLHERHRAPVLHGGARPCDCRSGGYRRNTVVAEPFHASGCNRTVGHRSGQLRSWHACCWRGPRPGCPGSGHRRRRGSRGGGAAAGGRPAARTDCAFGGRPGGRGVPGGACRVRRCDRRDPTPRGDTFGGPVKSWCDAAGGRRPVDRTHARPRPGRRARRRGRPLHLGSRGDGLEQRGGLPIGQRRTGDGDRRFQRDGSVADAARSSSATSPTGRSTTSSADG